MKTNTLSLKAVVIMSMVMSGIPHLVMAAGDSTTVTITGMVNDNTCTLTGSGDNQTFSLSPVSVRDFNDVTAGDPVEEVTVPIEFKDCGSGTKGVTVKVSGEPVGSTSAFKNALDGDTDNHGATGVGVNFYDTDGTLIKAGENVDAKEQSFGSEGMTLKYKASYTKVADEVKSGSLSTLITLYFTYS